LINDTVVAAAAVVIAVAPVSAFEQMGEYFQSGDSAVCSFK